MAELLKNWYNEAFFEHLCLALKQVVPTFGKAKFLNLIYDPLWDSLELKARTRRVTITLHQFLSADFKVAVKQLLKITAHFKNGKYDLPTYPLIFLPDYVELYGMEHFDESMNALEQITQLISAEFAIRPFIISYPTKTMKKLSEWSQHNSHDVRRLSSEGCRPRLPWAMALPDFKNDPSPILPILENLKNDRSEYVRRSVANNLNDISKDHPDLVLKIAKKWKGISPETEWILKHGTRTLLKNGRADVLTFHGFNPKIKSKVSKLEIKKKIKIGGTAEITFQVSNLSSKQAILRIEYAIHYLTSTGKVSKKVFMVTEKNFKPRETMAFKRKQRFTDFTTRKHFPGKHKLELLINGKSKSSILFNLVK